MHVRVAKLGSTAAPVVQRAGGMPVDAPPTTARDTAKSFDVDMNELAGPGHLDTADRLAGGAIEMIEPVQPVTHQHRMHGRSGHPHDAGNPRWSQPAGAAKIDHPSFPRRL